MTNMRMFWEELHTRMLGGDSAGESAESRMLAGFLGIYVVSLTALCGLWQPEPGSTALRDCELLVNSCVALQVNGQVLAPSIMQVELLLHSLKYIHIVKWPICRYSGKNFTRMLNGDGASESAESRVLAHARWAHWHCMVSDNPSPVPHLFGIASY